MNRVFNQGNITLSFRRNFGDKEELEFSELLNLVAEVNLTESNDSVKWVLDRSGAFITKSMYKELMHTGFSNRWMLRLWQTKVPLKITIFLWQVINESSVW